MKAWELEYKTLQEAIPVILEEEDQTWDYNEKLEADEDVKVRLLWSSNVPGSGAPEHVIVGGIQSMENMGYKVESAEAYIEEGMKALKGNDMVKLHGITSRVFRELRRLPKDESADYWNYKIYNSWNEYEEVIDFPEYDLVDVNSKEFEDKVYAGWLAQICGGAFGTAIEGYTTKNIRKVFGEVKDYVRKPNTYNDDITYELAFLKAFEEKGYDVTSEDIAEKWVSYVPGGWSAEEIALKNIRQGIYPPESGYFGNPFREWIGAQMRGAVCGMVAPGNIKEAARLAWNDGEISHHNNGIFGEVFNSVMVSLAFVESDIRVIVEKAMSVIPSDCEYYSVLKFAIDKCKENESWENAWVNCEEKYKKYNWIHAYPNAASEIIALWYGNGNFDETMYISGMTGQDVDCNVAQIMNVVAIIGGTDSIDKRWKEPIGDDLITYIRILKKIKISELAKWTVDSTRKAIK